MHKSATKCNETVGKWCKNKHGASKIIDTFETYQGGLSTTRHHHLLFLIDKEKSAGTRREKNRGPGESRVYQASLQAMSWAAEPK
jgi:hypothetical protein